MISLSDPEFLQAMAADPLMAGQIAHVCSFAAREGIYRQPVQPVHERLRARLEHLGYDRLFSHQAAAYDAVQEGKDLVVVSGTNSGKTLCYNLPVIQKCLTEPSCKALYLFPTKALAQDQLGKIEMLVPGPDIRAATYDGDTPRGRRAATRQNAHIILSNPDMLHLGILPGHELWSKFLKSLRVIVLDEMHVYRGVFGSHVGNVIRRLVRLCEWHHNGPQIIGCSATIGNPRELFSKLTGRTCELIEEDGAPKARRTFVFWNPPKLEDQTRLSPNIVTSEILSTLCESGQRALAFCRARVTTELVLRYTRERLTKGEAVKPDMVESYRSGYTPKERRQIEKAIFKGDLLGLVATNAMELGVDIGGLDAVVMNGYPGTISSFWQQAGRAGRGTREGLAILVAQDDPLEQFLVHEPHRLLEGSSDSVAINPFNKQILTQHLRCTAFERPISPSELEAFGDDALEVAESLDRSGELQFQRGMFFYPSHEQPAGKVNIRGSSSDNITLTCEGVELGQMERWRAMQFAHEGAVYLHRGSSFLVKSLNLESGQAEVEAKELPYYTQALMQSTIDPQVSIGVKCWGSMDARLEGVKVTDLVAGYKQIALEGQHLLATCELTLPPLSYETLAVRLDLPFPETADEELEQTAALHGLEHALMAVAPLIAGCDRGDLGSAWFSAFPGTFRPALFVFDRTPGGVGLVENLFGSLKAWASAALQLVTSCNCVQGCPSCLLSARCEANNEMLSKAGAVRLLRALV